jgi:hypothetical protein
LHPAGQGENVQAATNSPDGRERLGESRAEPQQLLGGQWAPGERSEDFHVTWCILGRYGGGQHKLSPSIAHRRSVRFLSRLHATEKTLLHQRR